MNMMLLLNKLPDINHFRELNEHVSKLQIHTDGLEVRINHIDRENQDNLYNINLVRHQ